MGVPENGAKAKMIQSPLPLTCWPCLCPNLEQELLLRMDASGQGTFGMPPFGSENGRTAQRKQSQQWGPSREVTHSQESFFAQASWGTLFFSALVSHVVTSGLHQDHPYPVSSHCGLSLAAPMSAYLICARDWR